MLKFCTFLLLLSLVWLPASAQDLTVGSKNFTENVVLGELITQALRMSAPDLKVNHRAQLGGTRVLWGALQAGEIDIYPEYTGTLLQEILHSPKVSNAELRKMLRKQGVGMSRPLGFNNTYALGMLRSRAEELKIEKVSDLVDHPDLQLGFGNEFMSRQDGWPSLQRVYALPQKWVRGFDHDLAYRALKSGEIDVTDAYSTDAEIQVHKLTLLEDDLDHFPRYDAVIVYRLPLESNPAVTAMRQKLAGSLDESMMRTLNREVRIEGQPEAQVAGHWLGLEVDTVDPGEARLKRIGKATGEHLLMVVVSVSVATLLGIPLGMLAYGLPRAGRFLLAGVGLVQTIPSLALLVFLIPVCGLGQTTAIVALTLYGLLPVVQGVYTGLHSIPAPLRESARALGLSTLYRWRRINLPLALPAIVAGIQTSAVIAVGTATLAALIGGGGYGDPILTGVRLARTDLLLEGAIPAAAMAVIVQGIFAAIHRRVLLP